VRRESDLRDEFAQLPQATDGSLATMRSRLSALEGFMDEHKVWHGALGVLSERSELRIAVARATEREDEEREAAERALVEEQETVDLIYARARLLAEHNDFETALEDFLDVLERAPEDWEHRERTERDVAAIREFLESKKADAEKADATVEDQ